MTEERERMEPEVIDEETVEDAPCCDQNEIEQWREALETAVAQRDEYLSLAQRTQAEFQNFKRRNAMARTDGYDDGVRDSLLSLLPALDAMEMAVSAARESGGSSMTEGIELLYKQMSDALSKLGLEEVPALNEAFDPEYHNAVMREVSDDPGKVLEVFQKGYRVKGRILRYAMVKVAVEDQGQ